MIIDKETKLFGSFSRKPGNKGAQFFNQAFQEMGINAIYKPFYIEDIKEGVAGARSLGLGGFAVAMPYKKAIIPLLDSVEVDALQIGAVNTVVIVDNFLKGYNTDYLGICKLLPILDIDECTVVGNGGLAATVTYCLQEKGIKYDMITRSNWSKLDSMQERCLINCTPVPLDYLHSTNQVIDLNIGYTYGDLLHRYQAQEQFRLYTGLQYGTEDFSRTNVQEYN